MQRNKIYKTSSWKRVRQEVMEIDHYECQRCNGKIFPCTDTPRITKAVLVHHIYDAKEYPQYKYSVYVTEDGKSKRNLVSLCFDCHEIIHNRKFDGKTKGYHFQKKTEQFWQEERFD